MKYKTKVILYVGIAMLAFIGGAYFIYQQRTHFNENVTINGINVGGLNAKEAQEKLAAAKVEKKVYLNKQLIYTAEPTESEFSSKDLAKFEAILKKQATTLPNDKKINYTLTPAKVDGKKVASLKANVEAKLNEADQSRKAPVDAYAILEGDEVKVVKEQTGNKYDVSAILKEFSQKEGNKDIYLTAKYLKPVKENSAIVKQEEKKLKELTGKKITYTVQKTEYELTTADILTSARYQAGKYQFDTQALKNKVVEINQKQAT